eukprot:TRINITY_DN6521_c0_g1_i1.p1 TRINITY_DN6521_c0_g1~~TRINITY_DN6521_c0_g1_i1.p1  ORF type:complete len:427 (-),score=104.82 TRINITY_DN6521_c0_g1_i1:73-1353(-)
MSYTKFEEHFWGPGGCETIEQRLNQGSESTKLFSYFLEERSIIEETYAKSLGKLLKATSNLVEFGTLRDSWLSIRGETENIVKIHHEFSVALHKDLAIPLNKYRDEQNKLRRQYLADASKINRERKTLDSNVTKSREKYEDVSKKADAAEAAVEQAKAQAKPPNKIAEYAAKAQKLAKDEMLFEHEYKESISKLGSFQPQWEEKLASVFAVLQQQEEDRIDNIKQNLDKFIAAMDVGSPFYSESCKRMRDINNRVEKKEDIQCFIREHQTGTEKPVVPVFVSFRNGGSVGASAPSSTPYSPTPSSSGISSPSFSSPSVSSPASSATSSPSAFKATFSKVAAPPRVDSPVAAASPPIPSIPKRPPVRGPPAKKQVKAIYDYVGSDANELDFFANDIIVVLDQDDSGWWTGEVDGRKGLFPSNYVEEL